MSAAEARIPIVAIVGRPNVGKSSLFNRFAGHRRALVEDVPGITRDRIAQEIRVGDRRVLIVDTAGLDPEAEAGLPAAIQAQARAAVEAADAVLFVVDGGAGCLPADETIARSLRRTRKPILVAVNKVDLPMHAPRTADFHRLGLEPVRGVSAVHAGGAWDALEELVARIPESVAPPELEPGAVRVAIVGRPNVGKSSLVNRLVGEERIVVSDQPGTTRDAIDIRLERDGKVFVLIDTAGLRRPGRRGERVERGSALVALRQIERADVALIVIDAAEGFTDQDARVAGLVRERGRAAALAANKWDLVAKKDASERERTRAAMAHGLRFMADTPMLEISARTGKGLDVIFPTLAKLANVGAQRVPTAELNRWLRDTVARHEPSMAQRGTRKRPIKLFYATQTGVRPPTFVVFCTDPAGVREAYRRFLEKQLRERFALGGTPIRLLLRARTRKDRDTAPMP